MASRLLAGLRTQLVVCKDAIHRSINMQSRGRQAGPVAAFPDKQLHGRRTRKLKTKYYAKGLYGKYQTAYRIAIVGVNKANQRETQARHVRTREKKQLYFSRVTSACMDLSISYSFFKSKIRRCNVMVNNPVLAELAMQEPRTFRALTELARKKETLGFGDCQFHDGFKNTRVHFIGDRPLKPPALKKSGEWKQPIIQSHPKPKEVVCDPPESPYERPVAAKASLLSSET